MRKTSSLMCGATVVAAKRIVYLPAQPETGLKIVPRGMRGKVVESGRRGYRTVKFDDGQVVVASVKELTAPGVLDRITGAIFTE